MRISLIPYGPLVGVLGEPPLDVELEASDAQALLAELHQRFPALEPWTQRIACACGDSLLGPHSAIHDGDEIALIPPVSGG